MKIGILTLSQSDNYGAMLQAYALQQIIRQLGHDSEIINLSMYHSFSACCRHHLHAMLRAPMPLSYVRAVCGYEWFRNCYFRKSPLCRRRRHLRNITKNYDVIIVGSDQIWNTEWCATIWQGLPHFLDFADGVEVRRISYAACVGDPDISAASFVYAPPLLNKFKNISVRNDFSKRVVDAWTGRDDVVVVADPTLLYDFKELKVDMLADVPESFILVYAFSSAIDHVAESALATAKAVLHLPVVAIVATGFDDYEIAGADIYLRSATPRQWVTLFSRAAYVLTNSFHGTIFALKNSVRFNTYIDEDSPSRWRILDLAERYFVKERILSSDASVDNVGQYVRNNLSEATAAAVAQHVEESWRFLKRAVDS